MNNREAFLRAIAASPEDELLRLVYADWLEEQGHYEEARRQRHYPDALKFLNTVCAELNRDLPDYAYITRDRLLEFGREVAATERINVEVSSDVTSGMIIYGIRDRLPDFWRAWSVVTGLPLHPEIEKKCYYSSGYCCPHEIYADTHVAGPISEEFRQSQEAFAEAEAERQRIEEIEREQGVRDHRERRYGDYDKIQDDLEKD